MDELYPGEGQIVPDPYGYPLKNFEMVFNMIDQACDAIVEKYAMETIWSKEYIDLKRLRWEPFFVIDGMGKGIILAFDLE